MIHAHEIIYRGNLSAIGAFNSQIYADALVTGNIIAVYFEAESVSGFSGDWYFGLLKNGDDILIGANRVQITAGDLEVEKTGLALPVNFRDRLTPTVDARGAGTINGPITVIILVDDGLDPVLLTGNQTIAGVKTFSSSPVVPTPTGATEAANKGYVDAAIAGLSWKQKVRAATAAAGTLATDFDNGSTIDGVVLATGDRILIKDQAAPAENGIYVVAAAGAPARASDADSGAELVNASVYVSEGTANADKQFVCTANAPINLGVTALTWSPLTLATALSLLTDVLLTGPADGQLLRFNGTQWVNSRYFGLGVGRVRVDSTEDITIGDESGAGNGTVIYIDDATQTITFSKIPTVPDDPYDATGWAGNLGVPTKKAIRDKIEALIIGGGGYTDEQAQDAVGNILSDTGDIDFNYDDATPAITGTVKNDSVTFPKMQNIGTDRLLGRVTAGSGDVEEIPVSDFVQTILDDADAAAVRDTIGAAPKTMPQNVQSANYTAVLADANGSIHHPAADTNNRTFTIPSNASVAYPINTMITFTNEVNTVTIAIDTDTLVWSEDGSTGSRSLAANGMATAIKITATKWLISGVNIT